MKAKNTVFSLVENGFKAGEFKLWGTRDLHFYKLKTIKRVRVVRRCDGYYAQFLLDVDRKIDKELTGVQRGLDERLKIYRCVIW